MRMRGKRWIVFWVGTGKVSNDLDRGVCGACVRQAKIQIENDVSKAADHIACSSETKAEIVLPIINADGDISAVLDIDSLEPDVFDSIDVRYLTAIIELVSRFCL